MGLRFEWDGRKAAANLKKHGVSFEEATTIFSDPLALTISDPDHSATEARFLDLGMSHRGRLLVVSYTERGDDIRTALDLRPNAREKHMKRKRDKQSTNSLRPEYDFSHGTRGRHAARYAAGTNVVVLEPDVAETFPTAAEVNDALRALARVVSRRASSRRTEGKSPNKRLQPTRR